MILFYLILSFASCLALLCLVLSCLVLCWSGEGIGSEGMHRSSQVVFFFLNLSWLGLCCGVWCCVVLCLRLCLCLPLYLRLSSHFSLTVSVFVSVSVSYLCLVLPLSCPVFSLSLSYFVLSGFALSCRILSYLALSDVVFLF